MTLNFQMANLGALCTLAFGLMGLLLPRVTARFASLAPLGGMGLSQIRATYGGLFTAMALVALLAQNRQLFVLLGTAWIGAAAGRLFSLWWDRNRQLRNAGIIIVELVVGYLLLTPVITSWWRTLFG